jgi:hypothetical protein
MNDSQVLRRSVVPGPFKCDGRLSRTQSQTANDKHAQSRLDGDVSSHC